MLTDHQLLDRSDLLSLTRSDIDRDSRMRGASWMARAFDVNLSTVYPTSAHGFVAGPRSFDVTHLEIHDSRIVVV
jgi:hypothetical protein